MSPVLATCNYMEVTCKCTEVDSGKNKNKTLEYGGRNMQTTVYGIKNNTRNPIPN